ncbi:BZ3500_MvSof-1268-A1-R1_Chr12-2g03783 [Microbotryum saponariae]|uniref:BZ3500_MvSof-1268-A1-R1_Chr12-2g03783 protein n=1 Tax=Microbotryum saponariae TaxID=289078 RepID=A0A2X0KRN2_9BASI|nr:BZ3500_MvSof-1268-A1-R1_Chr12-2g03783 [Microbotryum saponariae]
MQSIQLISLIDTAKIDAKVDTCPATLNDPKTPYVPIAPGFCIVSSLRANDKTRSFGCPLARRLWWIALSPASQPTLSDFVCPIVSRSERRLVELPVLFFHSIWKLSHRRRFSSEL